MSRQEFHIEFDSEKNLAVETIQQASGLTASEIKRTMQKGAVWLEDTQGTRRLRRAKGQLPSEGVLHVYHDPEVLRQTIEPPQLINDRKDYSIWFKPRGVFSQGSKWGDHCTINRWIENHDESQRPAFITHRLDRAACGLMIIAHGKTMAAQISQLFEHREMEKIYRVRVRGRFEENTPYTITEPTDGKPASTTILQAIIDADDESSQLTVRIDSGRKHQIRRHLADLGYPVLGDRLYGKDRSSDLQLCAWSLRFVCPIDQSIQYYEVPEELVPEGLKQ